MLGDSFRRLQADELDAEWDRLVRGEATSEGDTLMRISGKLEAMIPSATPGADARVRRTLFRDSSVPMASAKNLKRSTALVSAPLNLPRSVPGKRWWSSPMMAAEAVVACLIIAALALGISAYQSNDSGPSGRSFSAAESTPAAPPTPDWNEFRAMQSAALPTLTSWNGQIDAGELMMNLIGAYFPIGTGFSGNYTGVALVSALSGTVAVTIDSGEPIILYKGETVSAFVAEHLGIRNAGTETANMVLGRVYEPSLMSSFTTDEPNRIDYYAYFIGNAVMNAPSEPTTISLEIFDETTLNRSVTSNATELFVSRADPVTLVVSDGEVGIRSPLTSNEEYRTGSGYDPIAVGSVTISGRDSTDVLFQPGASYSLSAPADSEVLAFGLSVESSMATPTDPSNPALPTDVADNQVPSVPANSGSQGGSITLSVYPAGAGYPLQVSVLDITVAPASTWFGLGDWKTHYETMVGVYVLSGDLYTDDSVSGGPIVAGVNGYASSFIRNNDPNAPLVVRVAAIHPISEPLPESTSNTTIVPIASIPVERPDADTMRAIVMQSGTYTRSEGDHLDEMITLDDDFLAVESGRLLVEARGSIPIQVNRNGESTDMEAGESFELAAGDSVTFAGVDIAPQFTFVDNQLVSILTLSSNTLPFQRAYVTTQPQGVLWDGPTGDGTTGIILRELTFGPGEGLYYDFTGVAFYRVIAGTITVNSDSEPPILLTTGETYAATVDERVELTNTGNIDAVVIQAEVFAGADFERAWGNSPSGNDVLRKRLGMAQVTLPVQPMNIDFSWIDETALEYGNTVKGAALIANVGDQLNLQTSTDGVSVLEGSSVSLESISPDGFVPLDSGSIWALGAGDSLLAETNTVFDLIALPGMNVLAYSVTINPAVAPPETGFPANNATPSVQTTPDG